MSDYIEIYGSNIKLPERPIDEDAENYGIPLKEQKWKRGELPDIFDNVEYDKVTKKLILSPEQDEYADKELKKCKSGVWIWIGGKLRYITGRYYFYLNYYILEDGNPPDFREADRLYFLFWQHWFNILWCFGIVRIKKRRQGASSQSCSNILYESIFYKNSNCGLLSKTREDSKATFTEMVTNAYQLLPVFFKQSLQGKEDSVTELVLLHDKGANSKISYKAPVLNAYDRGRMSYVLVDEGGKYALDVPVSRLIAIISKTLTKGVKRVGWIDAPSTVNELTKGGGAEYKKVFDAANQFKKKPTNNRFVRFFQPAYEAYEGFIDEFGDNVIDKPTPEQYEYLVNKWVKRNEEGELISELSEEDISLGAKVYVMHKRRDGLEGTDLEEEVRMNPCDEDEAFMYAGQGCEFNAPNIKKQLKKLEDEPVFLRKCRLSLNEKIIKSIFPNVQDKKQRNVSFIDDEKSGWLLYEKPIKENHFKDYGNSLEPLNKNLYQIGVDTIKNEFALEGSIPTIVVMKQSLIIEGEETGMYPVAMYAEKTRLDVHFDLEVLKACMWYGCTANYEGDARTDFYRTFWQHHAHQMLEWTPKIAQNPAKKKPLTPFTLSADPFQMQAQLQAAKTYIDGSSQEEYNGHVHRIVFPTLLNQLLKYNHSDRTKSDQVIAMMMSLLPMLGRETKSNTKFDPKPKFILPTYPIKKYA